MKNQSLVAMLTCGLLVPSFAQTMPDRLTIDLGKTGPKVSPMLYGIFFEEINRAGDGGIYAEMVQNRSFEDNLDFPIAWKTQNASVSLDKSLPLNANNPTSLRVEAQAGGGVSQGGFVGGTQGRMFPRKASRDLQTRIENGPDQLAVQNGKKYDLTLYARSKQSLTLTASLVGQGGKVLGSGKVTGIGNGWKKFALTLTSNATDANARLAISTDKAATFWLDMVALFPQDTWKGRKNGLRPDLMEKIAAMKPAFVRFPGGCYVEGAGEENRVQWKHSIGDIAQRPDQWGNWEYNSTNGLGYDEYLQMCEDLKAEPLFVINCGMGHNIDGKGMYVVPMNRIAPYVQDALDAIEYANGPVTSKWGALRAKNGHPKPYNLKYMEIGNENGGADYHERYALFHDAIKAKYPQMQLVANEITPNRTNDIFDPHMYAGVEAFLRDTNRFDNQDRKGAQVYFGEYAVTDNAGTGNLWAALGEAAFMTGLERNGDIVKMSSYAPLLCREGWRTWNPNAILFDQSRTYGTPSYYVQTMFGSNRSDQIVPVEMQIAQPPASPIQGKIGLGTWNTVAEFKDIKVTQGDKTLFQSDFTQGSNGWQLPRGQWKAEDGALKQTTTESGTLAMVGDPTWHDYTLTLKARKISGDEGFLITFGARNEGDRQWWNIGGWGNNESGIEATGFDTKRVPCKIETGRWYDLKIEVSNTSAKFYLDGKLIHDMNRLAIPAFAATAGRDTKTGETILKFVNTDKGPRTVNLELKGAKTGKIAGKAWVLTSASERDENSYDAPTKVAPREEAFTADAPNFSRTFPANSVTVIRWK